MTARLSPILALQHTAACEPSQPGAAVCSRAQEQPMKLSLTQLVFRTRLANSAPDVRRGAQMVDERKAA